jgi:thiazole/oxazole-forming peptide maturase SagD family component
MVRCHSYPGIGAVLSRYARVGGNQAGILPAMLVSAAATRGEPYLRTATASMPQYHRLALDDPHMEMQYHLTGYGCTNEDAVARLTGEAVERYAAMMAMKLFEDRVEYSSRRELSARASCVPLDYLGIFDKDQQRLISRMMPPYHDEPPGEDDVIAWISCPSLTRPGCDVYVPAQLMFLGFRPSPEAKDKMFTPSFSTGTAAHTSLGKAMLNALVEAVQIDAFIINWYTQTPVPAVDIGEDGARLLAMAGLQPDGPYDARVSCLSRPELPLPNLGVTLVRKASRLPYIAFGLQADRDPAQALMRGAAESTAVLALGRLSTIFDLPRVHFAEHGSAFTDLDTNVLYYASPRDARDKRQLIESRVRGSMQLSDLPRYADSDDAAIRRLILELAAVSKWATYLDITPPELADTPWKVVRVLIPELLSMCLPGFPPRAHPRLRQYGGVSNVAPHPLP